MRHQSTFRAALVALSLTLTLESAPAQPAGGEAALNGLRAQAGLPGLVLNPKLQASAVAHAEDMAQRNYFSHRGRGGSTAGKRARRAGYRFCTIAENIAKGQRSVSEVMQAWMDSPGHRDNILRRGVREYGLARAEGNVWVLVVAARRC